MFSRVHVLCRETELPEQEHELRRKCELVSSRISAAATLTHTTQCAQHAAAAQNQAATALGITFQKLAAFEADNVHVGLAEASHAFGSGCQNVAAKAEVGLTAAAAVAQVRMLRPLCPSHTGPGGILRCVRWRGVRARGVPCAGCDAAVCVWQACCGSSCGAVGTVSTVYVGVRRTMCVQ